NERPSCVFRRHVAGRSRLHRRRLPQALRYGGSIAHGSGVPARFNATRPTGESQRHWPRLALDSNLGCAWQARARHRWRSSRFLLARIPLARAKCLAYTESAMSIVVASELSKSYGAELIFRGVSFRVDARDRIGLVGPNGAGKTTLLMLLASRLQP